jgi:hypothetical protein
MAAAGMPPSRESARFPDQKLERKPVKVYMMTDMEGVSGIFDSDLQCMPYACLRWAPHARNFAHLFPRPNAPR